MNNGYSYDEAKEIISNKQRKNALRFAKKRKETPEKYKHMLSPMRVEFWMKKGLSEVEAKLKIKSQRKMNKEYWLKKGFTKDEAIKNISIFQKENSKKHKKKWDELKHTIEYKQQYNTKIEYYLINGFNYDEAEERLKNRQSTFSKELCIKKYGEKIGLEIFNERQHKWQDTLQKNGNLKSGYSKISQEFFYKLLNFYNNNDKTFIFFATKNIKKIKTYVLKKQRNI